MRPLSFSRLRGRTLSRIISSFDELSTSWGYVTCPLLTRLPLRQDLGLPLGSAFARLACVRHAASVHSEPGSNSSKICVVLFVFPKEEQVQRNDRDCLVQTTDRHSLSDETHLLVSLTLFSSLSSFQGTCCTCGVAGHPGGGATILKSTQLHSSVKSTCFVRSFTRGPCETSCN